MFTPIRRFMNKLTLAEIMREHVNRKCHATTSTRKVEGSITLLACGGKPPYTYSKDEFETEQSSPVFENLYYKQADVHLSETLEGYYEVTQRFWVKDTNNNVATYDATFTTPDYTKFRDQSGLNYHVYCAAGETEVTITPGVTYPIPQYYPNVGGPIVDRNASVVGQGTTHWVQFTDEPFQLALVDNSITRYQLRYIITRFEECLRQPARTCYINIYVHPYMTLSEDLSAHVDEKCSCTSGQKASVTLEVDGGVAPYVYSKDNFATQQSSPVFEDLCTFAADEYESEDEGYVESLQHFWVKDSANVIADYYAVIKRISPKFIPDEQNVTLTCASGETSVSITPDITFNIPQLYPLEEIPTTINKSYHRVGDNTKITFTDDQTITLPLYNNAETEYLFNYQVQNTEHCKRRNYNAYIHVTVLPYQET